MAVDPTTLAFAALELAIRVAQNRRRNLAGELEPYIETLEAARKGLVEQANAPAPEPLEEE